ncbi:MAG TPA: hypothetical protein VH062_05050 [Polyangiaceae bacterium]|jgi:hypothetical protein|nr:hypothetical protein [Polyangiaceae bacterium]
MGRAFIATVLGVSLLFSGCKEDADQSAAAISPPGATKCKSGIERAVKAPTASEATSIYYAECSALFSQAACRDAWSGAAKLPESDQIPQIAEACRKAYCPSLTAFAFEACRDDFKATPTSLTRAWPPLFDAILAREALASAPDVSSSMLVLYARLKQLAAQNPPPATSAVPEAASAVPSASASAPAMGSAAPPAPAGSAQKGALKPSSAKAKP